MIGHRNQMMTQIAIFNVNAPELQISFGSYGHKLDVIVDANVRIHHNLVDGVTLQKGTLHDASLVNVENG